MSAQSVPKTLDEVKGWFSRIDQQFFAWFLEHQTERGDLMELGAYLGKSAILMGRHRREGETFTVCDLFESSAEEESNQRENARSYSTLTRSAFETNYLAFHEELPEVIQDLTSVILDHVTPDSCRFVHVDASHLYEHVHGDLEAARTVLTTDGVVVCDDYRSRHTPGVAVAVWEAVLSGDLKPICVTPQKFYGTWGNFKTAQDDLADWLNGQENFKFEIQTVAGHQLLRAWDPKAIKKAKDLDAVNREMRREKDEHRRTRKELEKANQKLEKVRDSAAFRAGRAVTAPARKMRRLLDNKRS